MPLVRDIQELIANVHTSLSEFMLLLVDVKTDKTAYCLYAPGQFTNTQLDGATLLFDETLQSLSHPETVYFSEDELPMLTQVAQYEVVVVERDLNGNVTVKDGRNEPVSNHLGVGG